MKFKIGDLIQVAAPVHVEKFSSLIIGISDHEEDSYYDVLFGETVECHSQEWLERYYEKLA